MKQPPPTLLLMGPMTEIMPGSRKECCDDCGGPVWLGPDGWREMDNAEDEGVNIVLLDVKCAIVRYGEKAVAQMTVAFQQRMQQGS